MKLVETAIRNARLTISVLVFLMVAGAMAYVSIPKEAEPDIQIPIIYVSLHYSGISPEDSERLLLRPMETALKPIAAEFNAPRSAPTLAISLTYIGAGLGGIAMGWIAERIGTRAVVMGRDQRRL